MTSPVGLAVTDTWSGDALVIGGGPAGCATAITLARNGLAVCLVDDGRRTSWPGETLPAGSTTVVADVFGTTALEGHHQAFCIQAAWETEELQVTDGLSHPLGEGWLLDRHAFDRRAKSAAAQAGATIVNGHAFVARESDGTFVASVRERACRAALLIDATGRSAVIARRAGARLEQRSRLLACIVACPERGDRTQATTVESVAEGWWYSTPTPRGGRVLALVSDFDLVPRGTARHEWWLASLRSTLHLRQLASKGLVMHGEGAAAMRVSQAGTGWLSESCGPGWIAVGDAAAHFDPLSSQGLLTGILMGARAGQAVVDDTLEDWSVDYRMLVEDHLGLSRYYYGLVDRWPESQFWMRRIHSQ